MVVGPVEDKVDEVRADETGPPSDEQSHGSNLSILAIDA
jgi:hypothetical protein